MKLHHFFGSLAVAAAVLWSCTEEVDTSTRYVFKEETIISYLSKQEQYSEYVKLLALVPVSEMSSSTVGQLLSARGNYTCFAPTNDAIQTYLEGLVEDGLITAPNWDLESFPSQHKLDSVRAAVVLNSVIDGGDETQYGTWDFPQESNGEFPLTNMCDRRVTVRYVDEHPDSIYLNYDCPVSVRNRDIPAINGTIHCMEKVLAPKDISMATLLGGILERKEKGFLVAARVIDACGLLDTLSKLRDERYEKLYNQGVIKDFQSNWVFYGAGAQSKAFAPRHRNYGFTIFAETDSFWVETLGKPVEEIYPADIQQWVLNNQQYSVDDVFVADDNYKSSSNLLNQWITYHMLPFKTPANKLVYHVNEKGYSQTVKNITIPVMEFYATMGKRRLIKIYESKESNGIFLNRFPKLKNGRRENYHEAYCDDDKRGCRIDSESENVLKYECVNGIIYAIDRPLAYTDEVRGNLTKGRIRFESMSLFPEAMTNNIRKSEDNNPRYQFVHVPKNTEYQYFENLDMNDETRMVYLNAYRYDWCNLQEDEVKAIGRYEVTLKLPPVPTRSTYELRYRVLANGDRGVVQFYFGDDKEHLAPTGIPVDLTQNPRNDIRTGWEKDTEDDDYNAEVDKRMRNNMKMKGEEAIANSGGSARVTNNAHIVRHILLRQTLDPDKTYYLRMKSVLDSDSKEFYMDHLEWCAKEVYDNPNEPEDIW